MLRIAVISDRFLTSELIARLLRQHVEPVVGDFAIRDMKLDWPDDTPISDDEIQEYVGDPAAVARFVGRRPRHCHAGCARRIAGSSNMRPIYSSLPPPAAVP